MNDSRVGIHIFGYNDNVSDVLRDVNELYRDVTPLPTEAVSIEVVSTNENDCGIDLATLDNDISDTGGIGCQVVSIDGLDENWKPKKEVVVMKGKMPVQVPGKWMRIGKSCAVKCGDSGISVGTISIRDAVSKTERNRITSGGVMSLDCAYTVPRGQELSISSWMSTVTSESLSMGRVILRAALDKYSGIFIYYGIMAFGDGGMTYKFDVPLIFPELTYIKISAERIGGVGRCRVSAGFEGNLRPNGEEAASKDGYLSIFLRKIRRSPKPI